MKTKISIILIIIISTLLFNNADAQYYFDDNSCGLVTGPLESISENPFQGKYKPIRTDLGGSPGEAYFPVLIVFVQFLNDYDYPHWHTGQPPIFIDSMISPFRRNNSNWWNAYNEETEIISDFWHELSRGKLHIAGPSSAVSVVLPYTGEYYRNIPGYGAGERAMNEDIWDALTGPGYNIDWELYDKWRKDPNDNKFYYGTRDGYVDFIYKIHKSIQGVWDDYYGFAALSWYGTTPDYTVDEGNDIKINHGSSSIGSGFTCAKLVKKWDMLAGPIHEHCHFLFAGGHITYGHVSYGLGMDNFYSPYEMIVNEYMSPTTVTFGQTYNLGDFSSRNSGNGELLSIPIEGNESFLLANRTKISKYDRNMAGDTAMYDIMNDWDYGKGLYIYHIKNGIHAPSGNESPQDIECADGFWNWEHTGYGNVYLNCWTGSGFYFFDKTTVNYDNDESLLDTRNLTGDGLSLHYFLYYQGGRAVSTPKRLDWGKIAIDNCHLGTTQFHTNATEWYSDFEHLGDRWDAWNVGYNEMFSPYSSPSTNTWSTNPTNQNSGIFIYYREDDGGEAVIDIYRASEYGGNTPLNEILEATPPSKPMGVKHEYFYPSGSWCVPKITWNHNLEPDMIRGGDVKRYEVYRATAPNMSTIPNNYTLLATVNIPINETPHYEDYSVLQYNCAELDQMPPYGIEYPVRYRVKAVDNTDWASVHSDFVSTTGINEEGGVPIGIGGDNPILTNNETPTEFALKQNFPNPFNPTTNIQFDLPNDVFVKIKVYDVLGKEVATLVNEYKMAGSYIVSFNGSLLSSGIYFYKIEAGTFSDIKRMVLVK